MVGIVDIAVGVGGLLGGVAANKAAKAQVKGSKAAVSEQQRQFDLIRSDLAPFREAGVNALNQLVASLGGGFQESDAFRFNLGRGIDAINRTAAARGKALSGEAVRGAVDFASGLASGEINNFLNRLASLAGIGQTATTATGSFGANAAGNIGSALINAGDARASGFVGGANAINSALNNLLLLNALQG